MPAAGSSELRAQACPDHGADESYGNGDQGSEGRCESHEVLRSASSRGKRSSVGTKEGLSEVAGECSEHLPRIDWSGAKGRAIEFTPDDWHQTIAQARRMEELIQRHSAIMDEHDPERRIALVVDEWGTWYDQDPGFPVGSLYQQNTIRDAIVASLHFNTFHRHCDRVRMANIAQMVNVLQAMILTDGEKMITTPTYHAFDLYTDHHDADHVGTSGSLGRRGDHTVSFKEGAYTISATNSSLEGEILGRFELPVPVGEPLRAEILTAPALDSHNTFEEPGRVRLRDFSAFSIRGQVIDVALPLRSITTIRVSPQS